MSRPIFSTNPSFGFLEQSISTPYEKPLPPPPRRPSSVYTVPANETEQPYDGSTYGSIVDHYFGNELLQPKTYRASASRIPEPTPLRPKLLRDAQSHAASDPIIEKRRAEQEHYDYLQGKPSPMRNNRSYKSAKQHAENYESVLHTRSSVVLNTVPNPLYSDNGHLPSKMSPRITDVVDQSLVPSPLRFSNVNYGEPRSRFSSDSSSDAGSCQSGLRDSIRSYTRKTFPKRSFTPEVADSAHLAPSPKPKSRLGSIASQRRASIQHGIEEMYDTLTSFSLSPGKHKPPAMQLQDPHKARIPRERRSPAIPLTPYQLIGAKAFEYKLSSRSSKTSFLSSLHSRDSTGKPGTPSRSMNSASEISAGPFSSPQNTRQKRPTVKKLAAAFQNKTTQIESALGLENKRSKAEKKRAELKKKITVVGLGVEPLAGGGGWM